MQISFQIRSPFFLFLVFSRPSELIRIMFIVPKLDKVLYRVSKVVVTILDLVTAVRELLKCPKGRIIPVAFRISSRVWIIRGIFLIVFWIFPFLWYRLYFERYYTGTNVSYFTVKCLKRNWFFFVSVADIEYKEFILKSGRS